MKIAVKVRGRQRLDALARRLDEAAVGLQPKCTAGIVEESVPALAAVKAAWLTVEVDSSRGGGSSSGLRGRAAAATSASPTSLGVRFEVDPGGIDPAYGRSLSWGLNGMGRWRHPVFGSSRWTQQTGEEVFFSTLRGFEPAYVRRMERVLDEVSRTIKS